MDRLLKRKAANNPNTDWDISNKLFLTIEDVATLLQVSSRTVYNLIYKGSLRACRISYHKTIITREDFFLMISSLTYHKRCEPIFRKQRKIKKQQDMKEVKTKTEGKEKVKRCQPKRQLLPSDNYKQSVRDTFIDKEDTNGKLYTLAEICQKYNYTYGRFYNLRMRYSIPCIKDKSTKCFPKAEVEKAMAEETERLGKNLSEDWYSCFDIMKLFGLGKTQVRRFALTHNVRTKRIHGNRLYYLKADWDEAREKAEQTSASTKTKRKEQ